MIQTGVALLLTLVSACALNWGYLMEHGAASRLPPLSLKRPLRTVRLLVSNRRWLLGFSSEAAGWGLYVAALALAPLALVQACSAGGIGVLAFLVSRLAGIRLGVRERLGVMIAIFGLGLLAISLAGGTDRGTGAAWELMAAWLGSSALAAVAAIRFGPRVLGGGAAFGLATGVLFAAGDISTKASVEGGDHVALVPLMLGFYALGTIVLQMGFQRGGALTTAGIATLFTNALPIAAGMTIFDEPLPAGALGAFRVLAFAAVVTGAVALARPEQRPAAPGEEELGLLAHGERA